MRVGCVTATERKRRERARRRDGLEQYRLELPVGIIEALISSGRLSADQALRPKLVEKELASVLTQWAERWRDPVTA